MLSDRRPILLANARIVDPSRDFDIVGDLLIADGVVRGAPHGQPGRLGFVPDTLMDDPPVTKRHLLDAFARLLGELDFEHLLLALRKILRWLRRRSGL